MFYIKAIQEEKVMKKNQNIATILYAILNFWYLWVAETPWKCLKQFTCACKHV